MSISAAPLPVFRLLVLAGAIFTSVSSEFLPTGLLPQIAGDLGTSEARIGFLITVFAGTVAVTSIPMTLLTQRFSRKWLLVAALSVFAVTNVLAAIAPTYEALLLTRVLGGLAHGLFWSVAGPYTAYLVHPTQLARSVSITSGGGSLAFILGVPLTAAIGTALGWRAAFLVMAAIVVGFVVLVVVALPPVDHRVPVVTGEIQTPIRRDRSLISLGIAAGTVLLVATGHNVFYTYIAPWSIGVGGIPGGLVSLVLLFFGLAGLGGAVLAGVFGDRWPRLLVNLMTLGVVVSMALLALLGQGFAAVVIGMVLWSGSFGGLPPLFHTRGLQGSSARVRAISGSVITTAFNVAIGAGALIGGLVLDGWGVAVVPWVGLAIVAVGVVYTMATDRARIAAHPAEAHRG